MARQSKAAGSTGKCASCGKGLPKGIKSKMQKCPHCGKAVTTDSSAISEGTLDARAARLATTIELREAQTDSMLKVRLKAREEALADQIVEAWLGIIDLQEAATVGNTAFNPALHPKDRLGKWMKKLDAQVQHAIERSSGRKASPEMQAHFRAIASEETSLEYGRMLDKTLRKDHSPPIKRPTGSPDPTSPSFTSTSTAGTKVSTAAADAARIRALSPGADADANAYRTAMGHKGYDNGDPGTPRGIHDTYASARAEAQTRANQHGRDMGIRRVKEYGKTRYSVRHLPEPSKRFGEDAKSEVVKPNVSTTEPKSAPTGDVKIDTGEPYTVRVGGQTHVVYAANAAHARSQANQKWPGKVDARESAVSLVPKAYRKARGL